MNLVKGGVSSLLRKKRSSSSLPSCQRNQRMKEKNHQKERKRLATTFPRRRSQLRKMVKRLSNPKIFQRRREHVYDLVINREWCDGRRRSPGGTKKRQKRTCLKISLTSKTRKRFPTNLMRGIRNLRRRKKLSLLRQNFQKNQRTKKKIVIKPAVLPEKPKKEEVPEEPDEEDGSSRKPRDKVRDEFAERKRPKPADEEKIIITPAVLTEQSPEEPEEEDEEARKQRDKVRDEFGERRSIKPAEDEKIIIKPAILPGKPKKEQTSEESDEEEGDSRKPRDKVRDEFAERRKLKPADEEKIIIIPAVLTEQSPEEPEEEDEETRKQRDKVRDEFGERRSIK